MLGKGLAAAEVAAMLGLDEATIAAAAAETGAETAGRVLGSSLQEKLDDLTMEPSELCCPVSLVLFVQPVIASDGFIYEKASLEGLLAARMVSPMTRQELTHTFIPARQKQGEATEYRETCSSELLAFADAAASVEPRMSLVALQRVCEYLEVLKPDKQPALSRRCAGLFRQLGKAVPPLLAAFM